MQWTKTTNSWNQEKKHPKLSFQKGIYMLGGNTDEGTNVKVGLRRPQRGKLHSSKEVDETKHTNTGATELRSQRPRETDPCGEGSWPALVGTAIYYLSCQHTMASRKRCRGARPLSKDSVPLYVKPEFTALIKAKWLAAVWAFSF